MAARNAYNHVQSTPATTWSVVHGLGCYPVTDAIVDGVKALPSDVKYIDENNLQVIFETPQTGRVRVVGVQVLSAPVGPGSIDFEGGGSND